MDHLIYNALSVIFDNTLAQNVADFMSYIVNGLAAVMTISEIRDMVTIFSAAAGTLIVIYYFMDMAGQASRDMITLERLILSFVKLMIGIMILIYLPEILSALFTIVHLIYEGISGQDLSDVNLGVKFWGQNTFPSWETVKDEKIVGNGIKAITGNLGAMIICMLTYLTGWAARIAAYFLVVSNAVMLVTRAIFSPIAVAQCFEDQSRSNAVRYLKKFAADGLSLAVIAGILYAASRLQATVTTTVLHASGITAVSSDNAMEIVSNYGLVAAILVINLGAIGAIMKANQLASDVVGAH